MADTTDKSYKTGVSSTLNIYRYVGVANAEIMHHLDLCLEEYIEYLQEHTHLAVFENGVKKYEITYQLVGDDVDSFAVDINRITDNYTMYLDNMGGVVTVYTY
jgi:D-alanyl-D-alanine carboxypeptidase